jgi:hypothetical protein
LPRRLREPTAAMQHGGGEAFRATVRRDLNNPHGTRAWKRIHSNSGSGASSNAHQTPHQRQSAKTARQHRQPGRDETTEGPDSSRSPRRLEPPTAPTATSSRPADLQEVRTPRTPRGQPRRRRRERQSSPSRTEPHSRPTCEEQSPQTPTTSVPHVLLAPNPVPPDPDATAADV